MQTIEPTIDYISYEDVTNPLVLEKVIYTDMYRNYYWSDDFSAKNYEALARAGFISVTELYKGKELLIPEIQYKYALLDFKDLHISKKVQKLLNRKKFTLLFDNNLDELYEKINSHHKYSWFTSKYLRMLKEVEALENSLLKIKSVTLKEEGKVVAGEIGYVIGRTYTSLSGFSSRKKEHRDYGKAQLVLLAKYLESHGFDFWNLGHPYMDYKLALGAKIYNREDFLRRWKSSI
jgi:Leu/Phe-tRNA-protein transferase